ncbi:MAG: magnesium transporter [Gemmatimonadales bacterium]
MRQTGSFRPLDFDESTATAEPWERLHELIAAGQPAAILPFLTSLAPGETARAMDRLSEGDQLALMTLLAPEDAADVLDTMTDGQAADLVEEMSAEQAAAIVQELPSAMQADLLGDLEDEDAQAILSNMRVPRRTEALRLMAYEPDTAGGVMMTEYLAYREDQAVADVIEDLRANADRYQDFDIQYAYVLGERDRLVGVLRLRDLLLTAPNVGVASIMIRDPLRVADNTTIEDLKRFFDEHAFYGIPVVDQDDRLVGVVRRAAVERGLNQRATQTFLAASGIVGDEELRSMPMVFRAKNRLSWLSLNIILNVIAASVITLFQDTLSAVVILAVFLPIISDMSGCSGNQAVAVSIREMSLGLLRPYEYMRVVIKEGSLGILNGVALGIVLGALAFLWKGNIWLSLVVFLALAINTLIAVLAGGLIPLLIKRLKFDPAVGAAPLLTTVTDMCGFLLVLGLATMVLDKLV